MTMERAVLKMTTLAAVLVAMVAAVVVGAVTQTYTLLNRNVVNVTEAQMTCMNGQTTTVTVGVTGELYELSTTRTNFSGDGWRRRMAELDRQTQDEQGHVVASMFGGPAVSWNLVPQHYSVNRPINAEGSILNRWVEFERWVQKQLANQGAPVRFEIQVKYAAANGCRPIGFEIIAFSNSDPGFRAEFDNGPYSTFAVARQSLSGRKK